LQRCFVALHDTLRPQYTRHSRADCFGVLRANNDLDNWHITYIKREATLFTTWLRQYHGFVKGRIKRSARKSATLKKILIHQSRVVDTRMHLERRLLFSAFETRGSFKFRDKMIEANLRNLLVNDDQTDAALFMRAALQKKMEHLQQAASRPGSRDSADKRAASGGGDEAHEGEDFNDDDPLPSGQTAVKEVIVHIADCYVQGIQLLYEDLKTGERQATKVHGNKHGQRQIFVLRALEGEKLVGIEGIFGRYITRLRFHTSLGRMSQWFGGGAHGRKFMLGKRMTGGNKRKASIVESQEIVPSNTAAKPYVDAFIIGLHGVCTGTTLLELGTHVRNIVDKGVFINCWTRYTDTSMDDLTPDDADTRENREFAYLLRMRSADLLQVKDRTQSLARRMYRNSNRVAGLDSLVVVRGISNWLFNALSHGLLSLPRAQHQHLEQCVQMNATASGGGGGGGAGDGMDESALIDGGYNLITVGRNKMREAKDVLAEVPGYDVLGINAVTESKYGRVTARAMRHKIERAEALSREGDEDMKRGEALTTEGTRTQPRIPDRENVRAYYERLVSLAGVKDSAEAIVKKEEEAHAQDQMRHADVASALCD
jgi:hypothetical protein